MSGASPGGVGLAFSPGGGFTVEGGGFAFAPGKQTPSPRAQGRATPASATSASSGGAAFYVREASASPLSGGGFTTGLFSFGGSAATPQPQQPSASPQQTTPQLPPFSAFAPGLAPAWATPGFKPPAPAFGAWSPMPQPQQAPPPMAFSPGVAPAARPAPRGRAPGAGGSPRGGAGASSPTFGAPPPTPPTPAFGFAPQQQAPAATPPPPHAAAQEFAAAAASFPAAAAADAGPSPPLPAFAPGAQSGSPRGPPRRAVRTPRPPHAAAAATPPAAHKPSHATPRSTAAAVDGLASLMRNVHLRRSPAATSAADEDSTEDTSDLDEEPSASASGRGSPGKRAHGAAASTSSPYPAAYVPQGTERAAELKDAATRAYRAGRYGASALCLLYY